MMTNPAPKQQLNPSAMSLAEAAQMLSRLGVTLVSEAMLQTDISAGAPVNADGTINLVHYAAWLVQAMGRGERDGD